MKTDIRKRSGRIFGGSLLIALVLILSLITPVMADPPALPHQFYGNATIDGSSAATGTTIYAYVNGVLAGTTTVDSSGRYGYDPLFTIAGTDGQEVTFYVGSYLAPQTETYAAGGITRVNLAIITTDLSVSTNSATGIGSTTATLNGNLDNMGGFTPVNVYFQYGLTTSYGSTTSTQSKSSTGAFTASLTGLTPNTTYYCRAVAYYGSTIVYGGAVSFSTTTSTLSVTTNDATTVTTSGATLNGNLTDLGPNSSVQVYFQYGTTPSMGSSTTPQTRSSTGTFTASLSGLMSNTQYYFRAIAVGTTTVYGSNKSFTTQTGSLAVTTGSATTISANGATLNGTLTSLGGASSVNVYFQYGLTSSYTNSTSTITMTSPGSFSIPISGLSASTIYHFRAITSGGSATGSDVTFTTLSGSGGDTTPPNQFYGYVYIGGSLAPSGTAVAAYVNGVLKASTTTDAMGRYGYTQLFQVPGQEGGTVTFYVNTVITSQTATWTSGGITKKNLYSNEAVLAVTTGSASYSSTTSAIFNGSLASLGPNTSATVSIEYGTTTGYGSSTTTQSMTSAGSYSGTATGLTSGTTYHYRAKAVGNLGTTVYGDDATYVHVPGGTLAVATNSATSVGTSSAVLNGNLSSIGSCSSAQVWFQWGTTTGYGNTTSAQTKTSTGTYNTTISGLSNGTTYHYRAAASCDSTTVYGSDVSFTTGAPGALTITTTSLASGTEGGTYSRTVTATGGTTPYTWSIYSGSLPPGLTIGSSTGTKKDHVRIGR